MAVTERLNFAPRELPAIVLSIVPPRTVSDRLRHRLLELFRDKRFSRTALCSYAEKPMSWISGFLTQGRGLRLNDLDVIAGYFHISIGELLGTTRTADLSGDEQRLVFAFRAVTPAIQTHVLALVEYASLVPRVAFTPATSVRSSLQTPVDSAHTAIDLPEVLRHGSGPPSPAEILTFFDRLAPFIRRVEHLAERLERGDRSDADPHAPAAHSGGRRARGTQEPVDEAAK